MDKTSALAAEDHFNVGFNRLAIPARLIVLKPGKIGQKPWAFKCQRVLFFSSFYFSMRMPLHRIPGFILHWNFDVGHPNGLVVPQTRVLGLSPVTRSASGLNGPLAILMFNNPTLRRTYEFINFKRPFCRHHRRLNGDAFVASFLPGPSTKRECPFFHSSSVVPPGEPELLRWATARRFQVPQGI